MVGSGRTNINTIVEEKLSSGPESLTFSAEIFSSMDDEGIQGSDR